MHLDARQSTRFTPRDRDILATLVRRVRVLTLEQIARTWFAHTVTPRRHADIRLVRLERAGLIHRDSMIAHPELLLDSPMAVWIPGREPPDWVDLARRTACRWSAAPQSCKLVVASKLAGTWLGGRGGRWPRPMELSHDISLAGVFLKIRAQHPDRAAAWVSEDLLGRCGFERADRRPDALIDAQVAPRAIELAGLYRPDKFRSFHAFCENQNLAYEIW